jgi:non-specific serine/threonine protein kinase
VPRAVAASIGVAEAPEDVSATLAEALRGRRVLLVLDNCEHLVAACARLAEYVLRNCPDVAVLITSREPLGVAGEVTWRVSPLTLPESDSRRDLARLARCESIRLFVERARARVHEFALSKSNAAAIVDVCCRLDGLPLAIELAAARVTVLEPAQIATRLDSSQSLLTIGDGAALPHQQTLRATLQWSYELLSSSEQHLFEELSVFVGGCTLEAVEFVATEGSSRLDELNGLVARSLVIAIPGSNGSMRFRLLETVRQFALDRLAERHDANVLRKRHAAFYTAQVEDFAAAVVDLERLARVDRLDHEHDNLRAALSWLIECGDRAGAERLAAGMTLFWFMRGHRAEGREWLTRVSQVSGPPAAASIRARLLFGTGLIALHQGDQAAAEPPLEEALRLWRQLDDNVWLAFANYTLGLLHRWRGDRERATDWFHAGLTAARRIGNRNVEGYNLRGLGLVALDAGEYEAARDWAEQARGIATHPRSVCQALTLLGEIAYWRGDATAAQALLEESVGRARELGDDILVRVALPPLAHVLVEQSAYGRALAVLEEAHTVARDHGDQEGMARILEACIHFVIRQRQYLPGVWLAGSTENLRIRIGAPRPRSEVNALAKWLADARRALGRDTFAQAFARGKALSFDEAFTHFATSAGAGAHDPTALTARERQVVALVAAGLSNQQIADQLVISERTVESHVSNALGKLGIGSRTGLVAWAVERQLSAAIPR